MQTIRNIGSTKRIVLPNAFLPRSARLNIVPPTSDNKTVTICGHANVSPITQTK